MLIWLGVALMVGPQISFGQLASARLIEGEARVRKAGEAQWTQLLEADLVEAGDSVRSSIQGSVALLCNDGSGYTIKMEPNTSYLMREGCNGTTAGGRSWARWLLGELGALGRLFFDEPDPPAGSGASRGDSTHTLLIYPRAGKVLSTQPAFAWLPGTAHPAPFVLQVLDLSGSVVFERSGIQDTVYAYPAAATPLEAGERYFVRLSGENYPGPGAEDEQLFAVASESDQAALRVAADSLTRRFIDGDWDASLAEAAFAAYLIEEQYYTDALNVLLGMEAAHPGSPLVMRLKKMLFGRAGPPELIPE